MLAAIKMEVMTPSMESPDEGCIGWLLTAYFLIPFFFLFVFSLPLYVLYMGCQYVHLCHFSYQFPHASNLFSNCYAWQASWDSTSCVKTIVWHYFKACNYILWVLLSGWIFFSEILLSWNNEHQTIDKISTEILLIKKIVTRVPLFRVPNILSL